jgi:hypothetical protein
MNATRARMATPSATSAFGGQVLPAGLARAVRQLRQHTSHDRLNVALLWAHTVGGELSTLAAPLGVSRQRIGLPGDDPTLIAAVSEAEDREWPHPTDWESGPDALRYPGLYDPVNVVDEDHDDDDLEPLDLQVQPSR